MPAAGRSHAAEEYEALDSHKLSVSQSIWGIRLTSSLGKSPSPSWVWIAVIKVGNLLLCVPS